mmetsp:Transcript_2036/g.7367  ORF Transcript_2036/g.7367 Transcript_2036/m.7367 type:complete len:209 (+) Transcript_2036:1204-1830(+)
MAASRRSHLVPMRYTGASGERWSISANHSNLALSKELLSVVEKQRKNTSVTWYERALIRECFSSADALQYFTLTFSPLLDVTLAQYRSKISLSAAPASARVLSFLPIALTSVVLPLPESPTNVHWISHLASPEGICSGTGASLARLWISNFSGTDSSDSVAARYVGFTSFVAAADLPLRRVSVPPLLNSPIPRVSQRLCLSILVLLLC